MSDDALIRLSNLKAMDLTPKQLSDRVGGRYTYWRDLLAGEKSFGERIARKIEEKLDLPRGHLDAAEVDMRADPPGWPLGIPYSRFVRLPTDFHVAVDSFAKPYLTQTGEAANARLNYPANVTKSIKGMVFVDHKLQDGTDGPSDSDTDRASKPAPQKSSGHR